MAADTRTVEQIDSEIKKLADERAEVAPVV